MVSTTRLRAIAIVTGTPRSRRQPRWRTRLKTTQANRCGSRTSEIAGMVSGYREQLEAGVRVLNDHFTEIKEAARIRLGDLFDASDYPSSLDDEFEVAWDFPSVEPPEYLQRLNPDLYQEQAERVSRRFERAVELAEAAFVEELDRLVNHLAERLSGDEDGRPKIFRDSAITNLREFFARFQDLNVGSNQQLDQLVQRALDGRQVR
jgi:hypothetical protein